MTNFQQKVYNVVALIPRGKTMTYKQVAVAIGNPKAYRTVGNALNKNYNLNTPCYRVIMSSGKIGGYNRGVNRKIELLKKEKLI